MGEIVGRGDREAWKLASLKLGSDNPLRLAAAEEGLPNALTLAIHKFPDNGSQAFQNRLVQLTDYHGPNADFPDRLNKHLGGFRYNAGQRHYALTE